MKKFFLIAAMAALSLGAQAQEKLYLSTYNGTNLSKYDGKLCNVTVNRYVFTGWNTIALPFAMSEQELNDIFGADCQLERLASVEDNTQGGVTLNFVNCKADGLQAATGLEHGQAAPSVMALNMSGPILKASAGTAWFAAMEKKVLAGDAASQATPGSMLFVWGRRAQSQTRGTEVPAGQHGEPLQKPCRSHLPSQHGGTQSCLLEIDCRSAATASGR